MYCNHLALILLCGCISLQGVNSASNHTLTSSTACQPFTSQTEVNSLSDDTLLQHFHDRIDTKGYNNIPRDISFVIQEMVNRDPHGSRLFTRAQYADLQSLVSAFTRQYSPLKIGSGETKLAHRTLQAIASVDETIVRDARDLHGNTFAHALIKIQHQISHPVFSNIAATLTLVPHELLAQVNEKGMSPATIALNKLGSATPKLVETLLNRGGTISYDISRLSAPQKENFHENIEKVLRNISSNNQIYQYVTSIKHMFHANQSAKRTLSDRLDADNTEPQRKQLKQMHSNGESHQLSKTRRIEYLKELIMRPSSTPKTVSPLVDAIVVQNSQSAVSHADTSTLHFLFQKCVIGRASLKPENNNHMQLMEMLVRELYHRNESFMHYTDNTNANCIQAIISHLTYCNYVKYQSLSRIIRNYTPHHAVIDINKYGHSLLNTMLTTYGEYIPYLVKDMIDHHEHISWHGIQPQHKKIKTMYNNIRSVITLLHENHPHRPYAMDTLEEVGKYIHTLNTNKETHSTQHASGNEGNQHACHASENIPPHNQTPNFDEICSMLNIIPDITTPIHQEPSKTYTRRIPHMRHLTHHTDNGGYMHINLATPEAYQALYNNTQGAAPTHTYTEYAHDTPGEQHNRLLSQQAITPITNNPQLQDKLSPMNQDYDPNEHNESIEDLNIPELDALLDDTEHLFGNEFTE